MVTMSGSPIGWGNDSKLSYLGFDRQLISPVGGSLRIPAHFSGCCALKPWPGRLPIQSTGEILESQDAIKVCHPASMIWAGC